MRLLVSTAQGLLEACEDYFQTTAQRCSDHLGPTYINGDQRCVIGNLLLIETSYEAYWLRAFKGNAKGLLAGLFDVHPNTNLANSALDMQLLHDAPLNWAPGGFVAWEDFFQRKKEYT